MAAKSTPDLFGLDSQQVWETDLAFAHLRTQGKCENKRMTERRLHELQILPAAINANLIRDELNRPMNCLLFDWQLQEARSKRWLVLFAQLHRFTTGMMCLSANDARGANFWVPLGVATADASHITHALTRLQKHVRKKIAVFPTGKLVAIARTCGAIDGVAMDMLCYKPVLQVVQPTPLPRLAHRVRSHLDHLEAESIHILREAVAESDNPVMLYSVGKDSSVMVHLARKAFFPAPPPFPLMHVDTRWKFQQMYMFREFIAKQSGMPLIVHINPDAIARDINPFDHGSQLHTHITKTEGLKQALDAHAFDLAFGGARRDEEKSRAKERIFSFRTSTHQWDPKNQRPEVWNLYNAHKAKGESIRVFPLSNWTELDVWEYILREGIPVVPLYFAAVRPVVERDGALLMVDDERMRLLPGEKILRRMVRFRTLGCYPLSGAIESNATTLEHIMVELLQARSSERQGRVIDNDANASMEKKKHEGYF